MAKKVKAQSLPKSVPKVKAKLTKASKASKTKVPKMRKKQKLSSKSTKLPKNGVLEQLETTLRILLVSDEHEEWAMLEKLVERFKSSAFDIVLMSGDQANCNNVIDKKADPAANEVALESMKRYVKTLEQLAPKMYYIPGNHDAEILFDPKAPKLGNHAINLHLKTERIQEGLLISGMGGSKPTLLQPLGATDWQQIYNPYPWKSDKEYREALEKAWSGMDEFPADEAN